MYGNNKTCVHIIPTQDDVSGPPNVESSELYNTFDFITIEANGIV